MWLAIGMKRAIDKIFRQPRWKQRKAQFRFARRIVSQPTDQAAQRGIDRARRRRIPPLRKRRRRAIEIERTPRRIDDRDCASPKFRNSLCEIVGQPADRIVAANLFQPDTRVAQASTLCIDDREVEKILADIDPDDRDLPRDYDADAFGWYKS
jgi:hypothetical protein